MDAKSQEGYARLPEDLLQDLLSGVEDVVDTVTDYLGPALDARESLREALVDLDLVHSYTPVAPRTVCGVDGGFAVERTAAIDLMLSVAVGVEGLSADTTAWEGTQYQWWSRADEHDLESERLARGVMVAQELATLSSAPHALRILDGSHLTLVIQLNSALTVFSGALRAEAVRVWDELETVDALMNVAAHPSVVAMPKYDSSRTITDILGDALGQAIPGDDKYVLGLLLRQGEYVGPLKVPADPWSKLHLDARTSAEESIAKAFESAIEPFKQRSINYTYLQAHRPVARFSRGAQGVYGRGRC